MADGLKYMQAFAEAGADVVFIDALESEEQMRRFAELPAIAHVPKVCLPGSFCGVSLGAGGQV